MRRVAVRGKAQRGFTLLEILVASVIMAVAISGMMSALSTSVRNAARLTDYDRATLLARQQMDELLARTRLPRGVPMQAEYDPAQTGGIRAGWRAVVTPFEAKGPIASGQMVLDRIELEVWWMAGDVRRTFALESYRRSMVTPQDMPSGGNRLQ
jgi:general secretion pathway protein I